MGFLIGLIKMTNCTGLSTTDQRLLDACSGLTVFSTQYQGYCHPSHLQFNTGHGIPSVRIFRSTRCILRPDVPAAFPPLFPADASLFTAGFRHLLSLVTYYNPNPVPRHLAFLSQVVFATQLKDPYSVRNTPVSICGHCYLCI